MSPAAGWSLLEWLVKAGLGVITGVAGHEIGTSIVSREWEPGPNQDAKPKEGSAGGEGAGKDFTSKTKQQVREAGKETCVYCHGKGTEVDHAIPKSKGGNNTIDNAQLTCRHCNASKGSNLYPKTPPKGFPGKWPPPWWGLVQLPE